MREIKAAGEVSFRIRDMFAAPATENREARISIGNIIKNCLEDNNLPDIKWHHLQSTFCTLLLKNNFNPKAVSKLMGHATELITLDVYGDNREMIADCVAEIQPFIDEVLPIKEADKQLENELLEIEVPVEDYLEN